MTDQQTFTKMARRAVRHGLVPLFTVRAADRLVTSMPWLEFDGRPPEELAEAARRAIAAELGVRASQIRVELD
jgi:hypothetical protein